MVILRESLLVNNNKKLPETKKRYIQPKFVPRNLWSESNFLFFAFAGRNSKHSFWNFQLLTLLSSIGEHNEKVLSRCKSKLVIACNEEFAFPKDEYNSNNAFKIPVSGVFS